MIKINAPYLPIFLSVLCLFIGLSFFQDQAYASSRPLLTNDANFQIDITPTPDRLAKPTLPSQFSQADLGAQEYWLHCLPCHGDKGQGLTDEFRLLYPVEEQNCWESGCHGLRPYENGWRLPEQVPPIIGDQLLSRFVNAAGLFAFIQSAMPFQDPGSLEDDLYYQLVAFLARENNLLGGDIQIDSTNAEELTFGNTMFFITATPRLQLPMENTNPQATTVSISPRSRVQNSFVLYSIFGLIMAWIIARGLLTVWKK